jgi:hypothetical protein
MFNYIIGVVEAAAQALDTVFGSNLAGAVAGFQDKVQAEVDATIESAGGTAAETLDASDYTFEGVDYGDALNSGADWGDSVVDKVSSLFDFSNAASELPDVGSYTSGFSDVASNAVADGIDTSGLGDSAASTAGSASAIEDTLDITEEELKYLRDIAEQEAVNRYTTAEITIEQTNNNNISGDMDLDGVVDGLTNAVNEAVDTITEGVH